MDIWAIVLIGLTTGGLSCLAMQGGLLASVIANQKEKDLQNDSNDLTLKSKSVNTSDWLPVLMFLFTKLVSHTLFGAALGALGSVLTLSLGMRIAFQIIAAVFMFATALNLLNVHPIFRFLTFQTPRFMQRWVRKSSKGSTLFAPATLGFLTVLVPCGVTQAMEVLAISSGNALSGALIMFAFVIGTSPIFGLVGFATAKLSESFRAKFLKVAAVLLIFMFLYNINGVLQVLDSPVSWQKFSAAFSREDSTYVQDATNNLQGPMNTEQVQRVQITVSQNGYNPNRIKVSAGKPVELTLETKNVYTCAASFTFRAFNIFAQLAPTDKQTFTFTPSKPGKYSFSCSMGMYTGVLEVI